MTLSENLYKLADRAKEAEQRAQQAQQQAAEDVHKAKADLEKTVNDSRVSAEAQGTKLRDSAKASQNKISAWWDQEQETWNAHLGKVRRNIDERKAERDAKKAETRAENAEADAEFAIDYAYAAIGEAEYVVLDAILARAEAEDAAAGAGSSG
jgi:hypothetical protein